MPAKPPKSDVCSCCKKEREEAGLRPRKLERLPIEVTQDKLFKEKGLPVRLCLVCDGDAYRDAMKAHEDRRA